MILQIFFDESSKSCYIATNYNHSKTIGIYYSIIKYKITNDTKLTTSSVLSGESKNANSEDSLLQMVLIIQ